MLESKARKSFMIMRSSKTLGITDAKRHGEDNPKYSLEGLMLKLKLQHFDHLIQSTNSLEKMLGNIEARKRRG